MALSRYFDIQGEHGVTQRIHWKVENGNFVITGVQLQSLNYGGNWYPGGDISVNGVPVFHMSYMSPATHVYRFSSAGDTFVDIEQINSGQQLPAASEVVAGETVVIQVDVELYDNAYKIWPRITGSVEIEEASVLALVHDGTGFRQKQPVIWTGNGSKKYRPVILGGENGPASGDDIAVTTSGDAIIITTPLSVTTVGDAIIIGGVK